MKVAFATNNGEQVNTHFGFANRFDVYEITKDSYEKLPVRMVEHFDEDSENRRIENRLDAVKDCTLLFINQIGAAAAAQVTRNQIMPIKVEENTSITSQLERLLYKLQTKPPLWLVKAMNKDKEETAHS